MHIILFSFSILINFKIKAPPNQFDRQHHALFGGFT
nr:MAG TPA: hypothetical protein [Caudoviricetes sp.]